MRRGTLARALLFLATFWWGVWFGGQLFNALMVVPHFSASPPGSLMQWGQMRRHFIVDFFVAFNSIWVFLMLAGVMILGLRSKWIIGSAAAALVSFGMFVWLLPMIGSVVRAGGPLGMLERWTVGNWLRVVVELAGFACALVALASARSVVD